MAHVFVSHSQKDEGIVNFFLRAFVGTNVKPVCVELETPPPGGVAAKDITPKIEQSNAIFLLLSGNVEGLKHTRDWVNWECAIGKNKHIWVFEPFESLGNISLVTPSATHYVRYSQTEDWRKFIQSIIEQYDNSHVLPTISASAAAGALLGPDDRGRGAAIGAAVGALGLVLQSWMRPGFGVRVACWGCPATYNVMVPDNQFRCPVCNRQSVIFQPTVQVAT